MPDISTKRHNLLEIIAQYSKICLIRYLHYQWIWIIMEKRRNKRKKKVGLIKKLRIVKV